MSGDDPVDLGRLAYEAYVAAVGGRSAVTGDPLPDFAATPDLVRRGWRAAADALHAVPADRRHYPSDVESRPGFFRVGVRCPWNVYRVGADVDRSADERFAVTFTPADGPRLVAALNAAHERGEL